jgi:hypothetical protein
MGDNRAAGDEESDRIIGLALARLPAISREWGMMAWLGFRASRLTRAQARPPCQGLFRWRSACITHLPVSAVLRLASPLLHTSIRVPIPAKKMTQVTWEGYEPRATFHGAV